MQGSWAAHQQRTLGGRQHQAVWEVGSLRGVDPILEGLPAERCEAEAIAARIAGDQEPDRAVAEPAVAVVEHGVGQGGR